VLAMSMQLTNCSAIEPENTGPTVDAEDFGAAGDGVKDDTLALRRAISAAKHGVLVLEEGHVYLVSGMLEIDFPLEIRGGGVLKASTDIEKHVGASGRDSLLRFTRKASGSRLSGITVDLAGAGRNAVDVEAPGMRIQDLTVRNYSKKLKSDNIRHRTTESGLRIKASDVIAQNVRCDNMVTHEKDSVPRCINVQGGVTKVFLKNISGHKINGGIVIGSSSGVRIDGYDFRDLTDNGLYILPGAMDTVATDGYLENTNEPVVFEGQQTRVSGLRVHNQGQSFGLENADGVILEDVEVTFDDRLTTRPAFIRTRRENQKSSGIRLRRIKASMPMGDSVLALAHGAIIDMELVESNFRLELDNGRFPDVYIVRQVTGEALRISDSTFQFDGKRAANIKKLIVKVPPQQKDRMQRNDQGNRFLLKGDPMSVTVRESQFRN